MKTTIFFLFTIFLLVGCDKDNDDNNSGAPLPPVQLTSFPLTIGNTWKYYTESHLTDSAGNDIAVHYYDNFWKIISDTTINGITSSKIFQLDSNYNGTNHIAYTYYSNTPDGFYGVAVENSGSLFYLKRSDLTSSAHFNLFGMNENSTATTDTVFVPDTALRFMKFPTNLNDIWYSYEYNGPVPDIIKRKWVGYKTLNTPAGTFSCIKLHMFWDIDHNDLPDSGYSNIYQYFSTKGLIQEEWDSEVTFGSGIDYFHRVTKLVDVNF